MIYRQFQDKKISALGMGCMRFPTIDGDMSKIDEKKTEEMFDYAIANGVNYFDTAWGYHGGQSEYIVGKLLKKYPRDSFFVADKFPGYDLANFGKAEEIFEEQLKKVGVEYFDFYLFHSVCKNNIEQYLDDTYGTYEYLIAQKRNGRIRHLGFSAHAELPDLKRFLEKFGKDIEFCQLQINWFDWTFQKAKEALELLTAYNIPVWVMEPVRGGKIASLAPKHEEKLKALRPDESVPSWAFRFLQTLPNIGVVLSGMSNFEQLKENIQTYAEEKPLNEREWNTLQEIAKEMISQLTPCTGCRYCTEYCPMGLDIPALLDLYNEQKFSGGSILVWRTVNRMDEDKRPSACVQCRACERVCPQGIAISSSLADFVARLK
jgi:predicted aldo/keto reductase-like oxidoreductase